VLVALNTAQLARRDFLFSDHDQVLSTPEDLCTIRAQIRTAHYSCSPTAGALHVAPTPGANRIGRSRDVLRLYDGPGH
jgi:hypothetical protein